MKSFSFLLFLFLFSAIFFLSSCSTQKETLINKLYEIKHWLTLQKYPCFGHCQVIKLSVYRNGLVIYEGKENVEKKGVYFSELSNEKINKFKRLSDAISWSKFNNEYMVNIADLPITEMQYFDEHGAKLKHIKANSNLPDQLHTLSKNLIELIASESWTQIQKKPDMTNPEIISNELVVDMDTILTKENLEEEFKLYDLRAIQKVSAYMNLWSFKYDEDKIGKYEMLILLRKKNGIRSVNFNRKLLPRE